MKMKNIFQKFSKISEVVVKTKNLPDKVSSKFRRVKGGKTRNNLSKVSVPLKVSLTLFLSVLLAVGILPTNFASSSSQEELYETNKQIDNLKNSIGQKRQQSQTLQNEITIMDEQVQQIELQIQATQMELAQVEAEITDLNVRIEETVKELEKQKDILAEHIQILYEEGQTSTLEIVASSENFSEFVNRSEYLENMQDKVRKTVNKIKALKDELDRKKAELTTQQSQLASLKKQQEDQYKSLAAQRSQKENLLTQTQGEEASFQNQLAQERQKQAALESEISRLVGSIGGATSPSGYSWPYPGYHSSMLAPGSNYIPFGYSSYYFPGMFHTGIDIYGSVINSASDGTVGFAGALGGYGNCVIVINGSHMVIYGHMSSLGVSEGVNVAKGQYLGQEGSTGWSTGSHLHFEIRDNGSPVDPMGYLP